MKITDNEAGGVTVVLSVDDRLGDVPVSHIGLITPKVREVFRDPNAYLRELSARCDFPEMKEWFEEAAASGTWQLELDAVPYDEDIKFAGFHWPELPSYARVSFPEDDAPDFLSDTMAAYFSLVNEVDTNGFGVAGGFLPVESLCMLSDYVSDKVAVIDPEEVVVWGFSPCGDYLVYTLAGEAGWFDHGNRQFSSLGSEAAAIDWIFGRLRQGEAPYLK